jgi:hypothetical protein
MTGMTPAQPARSGARRRSPAPAHGRRAAAAARAACGRARAGVKSGPSGGLAYAAALNTIMSPSVAAATANHLACERGGCAANARARVRVQAPGAGSTPRPAASSRSARVSTSSFIASFPLW